MILWRAYALILALAVGCGSTSGVIHAGGNSHGKTVLLIPRTVDLQPSALDEKEFRHVMRQLMREARLTGTPRQTAERMFQLDPQSGDYLYLPRDKKLVPLGTDEFLAETLTKPDVEFAERYRLWCQRVHGLYGDCLGGALVGGRYLDMHGRYVWALALSKSPVLDEMKKALGEWGEFRALLSAVLWTMGSMLLILALNPVAPALVAALGLGMILYVGYETLRNLVEGWLQLMEEVKTAATFEQLREAGERFGKILGRESAQAFAMLLLAAIGRTAHQFSAKVSTLPGSAQVAMQAEEQARISLSALGVVEEIALTTEGVRVTMPAHAAAMVARNSGGKAPCVETHHIATICNDKSTARGGQWTPRFRKIFAKAGMTLKDPANKLPVPGHYGPHPEAYHRRVFQELNDATKGCRTVAQCRAALLSILKDLSQEIATSGSELNQLVTGSRFQ